MPPPTSSVKPTAAKLNGAAGSKKEEAPVAAASSGSGSSRPDKAAYDAEQDGYNKEIAAIKTKLVSVAVHPRATRARIQVHCSTALGHCVLQGYEGPASRI